MDKIRRFGPSFPMRFLFTTIPGFGHFHPILPLATCLKQAGHTVAVASAPAFAPVIEAAGLEALPAGMDWDESRLLETLPEIRTVPMELQGDWIMRSVFLDRSPRRMAQDLAALAVDWKPDAILSGTYEFGGALAAESLNLPYISCSISFRWNRWFLKRVAGRALRVLRKELGLPPDPAFTAFGRYLDLSFVPPSWDLEEALSRPALARLVRGKVFDPREKLRQRLLGLRALTLRPFLLVNRWRGGGAIDRNTRFIGIHRTKVSDAAPPGWLAEMPAHPLVYVSLGTVFGAQYPEIFQTILDGLRNQPLNLVLTVGDAVDPAQFGPQPGNVRIERFIPREQLQPLLAKTALCVCHAGYGTVSEALALGVPLMLLPLAADQPVIAQMCFANGLSPELPAQAWRLNGKGLPIVRPDQLTPNMFREAARAALDDPAFLIAAKRLRAELRALPGLADAVRWIENVAESGAATER